MPLALIRNVKSFGEMTAILPVVYLIFDGCTLLSQLPEICSFLRIPMESAREVFLSAEACPSGELLHKLLTRHRAHLPQGALIMTRDERQN